MDYATFREEHAIRPTNFILIVDINGYKAIHYDVISVYSDDLTYTEQCYICIRSNNSSIQNIVFDNKEDRDKAMDSLQDQFIECINSGVIKNVFYLRDTGRKDNEELND